MGTPKEGFLPLKYHTENLEWIQGEYRAAEDRAKKLAKKIFSEKGDPEMGPYGARNY